MQIICGQLLLYRELIILQHKDFFTFVRIISSVKVACFKCENKAFYYQIVYIIEKQEKFNLFFFQYFTISHFVGRYKISNGKNWLIVGHCPATDGFFKACNDQVFFWIHFEEVCNYFCLCIIESFMRYKSFTSLLLLILLTISQVLTIFSMSLVWLFIFYFPYTKVTMMQQCFHTVFDHYVTTSLRNDNWIFF